jgi:hypothetical protein
MPSSTTHGGPPPDDPVDLLGVGVGVGVQLPDGEDDDGVAVDWGDVTDGVGCGSPGVCDPAGDVAATTPGPEPLFGAGAPGREEPPGACPELEGLGCNE